MLAQEEPSTTTGNLDPATRRSHRPLDMDYRIKANNPFGIYFFLRLLCRSLERETREIQQGERER
ncbi:hypothetical protein DVH24_040692 [Malus domestica]|uniref:Uncharacterized protein n=1 Tax=Malus domestica TaxID=3750 RepID=A0A498IC21_MALDO|nr:hypothetical protein DVH24_040692 [Malus domestica]